MNEDHFELLYFVIYIVLIVFASPWAKRLAVAQAVEQLFSR